MRVRAWHAQPDARSRPRWRRRLLIAGDAALALALAALAVASPAPGDGPRIGAAGIALALLQTLPLAFRRWRPVWVLAVVVAATLGAEIAREGNDLFGLATAVALYSVAAYCPRRQAAWAGIATGAVLAWPLVRDGGGPGGLQSLEQIGLTANVLGTKLGELHPIAIVGDVTVSMTDQPTKLFVLAI